MGRSGSRRSLADNNLSSSSFLEFHLNSNHHQPRQLETKDDSVSDRSQEGCVKGEITRKRGLGNGQSLNWDLVGVFFGIEPSEWERNTFPPLSCSHFPTFPVICSHVHTPPTKRGRLALSIRAKDLIAIGSPQLHHNLNFYHIARPCMNLYTSAASPY